MNRKDINLANMEVKCKRTEHIVLFWQLFSEVLSSVKGQKGYKFNPSIYILDENSRNYNSFGMLFDQKG